MSAWCSAHPWMTLALAIMALQIIGQVLVNVPNRIQRHWNIRKHGYPPPHCDADGDFRKDQ